MKINTNLCNNEFEKEITKVKKWLASRVSGICDYSIDTVLERLMQYLVAASLSYYARTVYKSNQDIPDCFPIEGEMLDIGCAKIELGTGNVTLSIRQWFKEVFGFLIHWTVCLLAILFTRKSSNNSAAVLVYGISEDAIAVNNSDIQFVNYCNNGQVEPLKTKNQLYIEFSSDNKLDDHCNFHYRKRPLLSLLRETKLGFARRTSLFVRHIILLFRFIFFIIKMPQISLLGREFAYCSITKELDRCGKLEAIILTCSSYAEQLIWVRELQNAKVHMVWYAQAWKPTVYCDDKLESYVPNIPWIRVDTHWVWTNEFAGYLQSLGLSGKYKVVGSIVWYLPKLNKSSESNIQITIFDISPFSDDVALEYGHVTNYHHPDNLFAFINDILFVKSAIEDSLNVTVKLCLKTKRGYKSAYDKDYFSYLDKLSASGKVILENYSENMYSLISGSKLVIAYPFTSPVYIADELKIPSIYYDPTNSICEQNFGGAESLINFVSSRKVLLETILRILK